MKGELLLLTCLLLSACATSPEKKSTVLVSLPCPEKPSLTRPHLETISEDAPVDQIMVTIKQGIMEIMAFGDEASKQEGCTK